MPTERRRRKNDEDPIKGFMGSRHSVHFDDIEFQRRFEQNLIRFNLISGQQASAEISQAVTNVVVSGGGGGGGTGCYWTKEGSNLVYYEGNVGVGIHPHSNDFEVRGNVLVEAIAEQPYVEIRNWSDTAYDPVIHWSVGATPAKKFTMGVDDSDSDAWLLCAGAYLSKTLAYEYYTQARTFGNLIVVTESTGVDRIHSILRTPFSSHVNVIGTAGSGNDQFSTPSSVCSDGVYVYVADQANDRVVKRLVSDLSYVSKSSGTAPNTLDNPAFIITDGTYLYVACSKTGAFHIYKLLCSDLSFVAFFDRTDDFGNNGVIHMATDGVQLYVEANGGNTWRMCRVSCATMTLIERLYNNNSETNIASYTMTGAFLNNGFFYLIGLAGSDKRIFKFNASNMTYVSKSSNMFGAGIGQLQNSGAMDTDGTFIYVTQAEVSPGYNRVVQFLLSDYSYVTAWGTYGNGNNNLGGPDGLCCVSSYGIADYTPANYPILAAANDGSYCDSYPLFRARDGFQLMEDGTVAATKYVGLYAPAAITASYGLTFPGTGPAAVGHFAVSAAGEITFGQNVGTTGSPTFVRLTLSQAVGTAPMTITSTTVVANLNVDQVDGKHEGAFVLIDGTRALTASWDVGSFEVRAQTFQSDVATGTAPFTVASTTAVTNLNADLLDGSHAAAFAAAAHVHSGVYEPVLGNPGTDGWVLSSTILGVRSWIAPGGGGGTFITLSDCPASYATHGGKFVKVNAGESALEFIASSVAAHALSSASHTDVDAAAPSDDDIIRFDTASGKWKNEALPAASNHDTLSATHSDTLAAAVVRGDIIYGNATPKWARLAKGTSGYILQMGTDEPSWATPNHWVFGDGSDGAVTISADTSLTKDMNYSNLTIDSGYTLNSAGFRIFVSGTLTINGTGKIDNPGGDGGNGGDATGAAAGAAGTAGGQAPAGSGTLGGAGAVGVIGVRRTTTQGQTAGTTGTGATKSGYGWPSLLAGKTGGSGTTAIGTGAGGAAGGAATSDDNSSSTSTRAWRNFPECTWPQMTILIGARTAITGLNLTGRSATGGSGGVASVTTNTTSIASGGSGGSGGGGGTVMVCAKILAGTGYIRSTGGNGGNGGAANGVGTVYASGGSAGGNGGPGGLVVVVYGWVTTFDVAQITAPGGAGGTGSAGLALGAGTSATAGENGATGTTGKTQIFN